MLRQMNVNELAPYSTAAAVTTSDTVNFTEFPRGIYVGGAGNVAALFADGLAVVFAAVPAGTILPIKPSRILAASTTATAMLALY